MKVHPHAKWYATAYFDAFRFPWLRFQTSKPSTGQEFLVKIRHRITRYTSVYAQYRVETKSVDIDSVERMPQPGQKDNWVLNFDYSDNRKLKLKSRIQGSHFSLNKVNTSGIALIQDVQYNFGRIRLDVRLAVFDTDDYVNRQYVYEKDVLYAYAIPAYNGQGFRTYWLAKWKVNRKLALWMKYAFTRFERTRRNDQASEDNEVRLQLMYKL